MSASEAAAPGAMELLRLSGDGFDLLARLHDREPDQVLISGLKSNPLSEWFGGFASETSVRDFDMAIATLPQPLPVEVLDDLAAEYADIYLTHGYRAAPSGSVWLTEERAERQEPMFAARSWYGRYHLGVPNWRVRPDDHIVHELQFVAHLCHLATPGAAMDAARFLDANLIPWLPQFTERVLERCRHRYFAAAVALTLDAVEGLRDNLEALTGIERRIRDNPDRAGALKEASAMDGPFVPGLAESW
jgi:TorA maturation chaperone TorD